MLRSCFVVICSILICGQLQAEPPQQSGPLGIRPSAKEIELGRKLFFDKRLSLDGTISCSTCHDPHLGWADGRPLAVGINGQVGPRHSPSIINSSYTPMVFWDMRTIDTTTQALLPLVNPIEMGRQTEQGVLRKIQLIPGYVALFAEVYGVNPAAQNPTPVTGVNLGRAIAAFESTVTSFDAAIDRFMEGEYDALTPDARVGFGIFERANCMSCHKPPLFTDNIAHNNGMEFAGKFRITDQGRAGVLPNGRVRAADVRAFKTPTLREIHRTAPYNHAGTYADLKRVVRHYNSGGVNFQGRRDRFIDPRVRPLGLTEEQENYLVTFLEEAFASSHYPMIEEPELP